MKNNERIVSSSDVLNKSFNVKLFPIYYMFSCDFLFFYAIEFVFLQQTKNYTSSQILFFDALIPLFSLLLNIPLTLFVVKNGKKKSLVIGNTCMCICLILIIFSNSIYLTIIAFLFNAIGFCFKGLTETNILADSINMKNKNEKKLFSLAYSLGLKNYLILDGITSFFIGVTYQINEYLPIVISLMFTVISTFISACFKTKEKKNDESIKFFVEYKKQFVNLIDSFKKLFKSKRIKALLIFIFLFSGFLYGSYSVRETLLTEYYEVNSTNFGIIIASLTILGGVSELLQDKIQKIFKNRTLTFISLLYVITFILVYIISLIDTPIELKLIFTIVLFAIQYAIDSLYKCFENIYQKNFTTQQIRVKISSIIEIIRNFSSFFIAFMFSIVVGNFEIDKSILYIGIVFFILFIFALIYMKPRFGLKREEYDKSDIFIK